jgi:pyruvate/2-oxoglutarate dehydrogenase complex dihydrolipoamide dehydrogenase (E3) component
MEVDTSYDVIVIGGGSAGTSAAGAAAAAGARTALVNDGELGGLCILRGCMPTKTLLHSAHALHDMRTSGPLGVHAGRIRFDFPAIMRRKDAKVERFKRAKIRSVERSPYDVIDARGTFVDPETVAVGGRPYRARGYVIATGSVASIRPIEGIGDVPVLTSDEVMKLEKLPESMVVQGSGPIGLELGQFFARLGVKVLLVNRSRPLSKIDPDCSAEMMRVLTDESNLDLLLPGRIERVRRDGNGIVFGLEGEDGPLEHRAEAFLSATGRRPALEGLGLEAAGIESDGRSIRHDPSLQTTNPRVYVAGDATGSYQVLHLANQEGRVAGGNAASGRPEQEMDYRLRMEVIFTDPPFAGVGMSALDAERARRGVVTAVKRFPEQGRAITMETGHGLVKVVADAEAGEILGAQIIGPRADDLVHVISAVMFYRGSAAHINAMPWYHPTLAETLIEIGRELDARLSGQTPVECPPA